MPLYLALLGYHCHPEKYEVWEWEELTWYFELARWAPPKEASA